jgi:hypothetical protein
MWRYKFNFSQVVSVDANTINYRLDRLLVMLRYARNITNARILMKKGLIIVNGIVNYDYNRFIRNSDIIQLRGARDYSRGGVLANLRYLG